MLGKLNRVRVHQTPLDCQVKEVDIHSKFLHRIQGSPDPGAAPDRQPLGREQLVQAAFQLLDETGLEGLTMRGLAEKLGVTAASLYWHVRRKEELLDLMHEAISGEVPEPDPSLGWRDQVEVMAWNWRRALLRHRDAARIAVGRVVLGPVTLKRMEGLLALLRKAGLSSEDVADAGFLLSNFVPGFVAEEQAAGAAPAGRSPGHPPDTAFAASLGMVSRGRLELKGAEVRVDVDPFLVELYRARVGGKGPDVRVEDGTATVRHRGGRGTGEMSLNGSIPWDVKVLGGSWRVSLDLSQATLLSLELKGGVSTADVKLPHPRGTVAIRCFGGVERLTLHRPAGVAVRAHLRGGVRNLTLDQSHFDAIGRETRWETPGYDDQPDRYEIEVRGGVNRLTLDAGFPLEAPDAAPEGSPEDLRRQLEELPATDYPNLVGLAAQISLPDTEARFRFGLQVLLDGLERRLERGAGLEQRA